MSQANALQPQSMTKIRGKLSGDRVFKFCLKVLAMAVLALMSVIIVKLMGMAWPAFSEFGFGFFFTNIWDPIDERYGALAFIYGTLMSSFLALLISVPISIGTALYLTEVAPKPVAKVIGFLVEMLAAIPSVVYGIWGIFVLVPILREVVQPFLAETLGTLPLFSYLFDGTPYGIGMLAAGIVLAIMITPTITAISREVFLTIPRAEREAALALGATKWETIRLAVIESAWSGMIVAIVLGLGRALGETMAVTMVIGNRADIALSLFEPGQSMASIIANEYTEASSDLHIASLVAVGITLFILALITNSIARLFSWKIQKRRVV